MATKYPRLPRHLDRYYATVGAGLGRIVGLIVVTALAALLFTAFYGRTPTGPAIVTSDRNVTSPDRSVPRVPTAPEQPTK